MVLELLRLTVRSGQNSAFERAFGEAQGILASIDGYLSHQLQRCVETPEKYALLVRWRSIEDHTIGFRQSEGFQEWKRLLYDFYDGPPTVEHFEQVFEGSPRQR